MDRRTKQSSERVRFTSFVLGTVLVGAMLVTVMAMQASPSMRHGVGGSLMSVDNAPGPWAKYTRRALIELDDSEDGFRVVQWGFDTMPNVNFEPQDPYFGVHHVAFGPVRGSRGIWARTATLSGHAIVIWNAALDPRTDTIELQGSDATRRRIREVLLQRVDAEQGTALGSDKKLIETGQSLRSEIVWSGWVINAMTIVGVVAMGWGMPEALRRVRRIVARVSGGGGSHG